MVPLGALAEPTPGQIAEAETVAEPAGELDLTGRTAALRPVGTGASLLADLVVEVKPDDTSHLKIRVYDSAMGHAGPLLSDRPGTAPDGAGSPQDTVPMRAAAAWWALETRLTSRRLPGHTLLFGNDLRVAPNALGADTAGGPAAKGRSSSFVEDRSAPWSGVVMTAGLRQTSTDSDARDLRSWLALETRPADGMVLRYTHGHADRAAPIDREDRRSPGHSVSVEQTVSPSSRWSMTAFDDPSQAAAAQGGAAAVPHRRGVQLAAVGAASNGTRLRLDYLARMALLPATDPAQDGGAAHRTTHVGRVAAALPLDDRWRLGAETVVVARDGAAAGYGLTHLVLESNALDPRTTLSLHVYDALDRRPADLGVSNALQPASASATATPMPEGRGVRLALGVPF